MNIVIPMAGLGSRFPQDKYFLPKPLIDVHGKPMIQRVVESLGIDGQFYFVIRKDKFSTLLRDAISEVTSNAKVIEIDYTTQGPACSTLLFRDEINNEEELVVTNCDQIMEWDPDLFLHVARIYDGAVVTYHCDTDKNSYIKLGKNGDAIELREKEVISNISLNGIHYWKKGKFFVKSAEDMIAADKRAPNGEFYIAPTYNFMIKNGLRVGIHHIPNEQHHAVGVPIDLERYLQRGSS